MDENLTIADILLRDNDRISRLESELASLDARVRWALGSTDRIAQLLERVKALEEKQNKVMDNG